MANVHGAQIKTNHEEPLQHISEPNEQPKGVDVFTEIVASSILAVL